MAYNTDKPIGPCKIATGTLRSLFQSCFTLTLGRPAKSLKKRQITRFNGVFRYKRAIRHNDPCHTEQGSTPDVAGLQPTFLRNRKIQNLQVSMFFCAILTIFAKVQLNVKQKAVDWLFAREDARIKLKRTFLAVTEYYIGCHTPNRPW